MNREIFHSEDIVPNSRAAILITHGLGEHSGRYDEWTDRLNQAGISVFRYDLPGHGRSRSGSWLFKDFEVLTGTLQARYQHVVEYCDKQRVPLFLFGHSMGGLVTADFVINYAPSVRGVILSAPALDPGEVVKPWMITMAGRLRNIVPGLPLLQIPATHLSRNPEVVAAYQNDPLVFHGKIRIQTGYSFLTRMGQVMNDAGRFQAPVLVLQGEADKIVRPEVTKTFYDRLVVDDKTWKSYPEMYHELLKDLGHENVKSDIMAWLLGLI